MSVFYLFTKRDYSSISRNMKENLLPEAFIFLSGSKSLFKFAFTTGSIKVIQQLAKIKAT